MREERLSGDEAYSAMCRHMYDISSTVSDISQFCKDQYTADMHPFMNMFKSVDWDMPEGDVNGFCNTWKHDIFSMTCIGGASASKPAKLAMDEVLRDPYLTSEVLRGENSTGAFDNMKYITPITIEKLVDYVSSNVVHSKTILGWLILLVIQDMKVPMYVFDSDVIVETLDSGKKSATPLKGSLFDQIPERLFNTIFRVLLEYMWNPLSVLHKSAGKIAHENLKSSQKTHLLKVSVPIYVYDIQIYVYLYPFIIFDTFIG